MPDSFATTETPLSPVVARQLNEVCDQFEAAWKNTAPREPGPRIEHYLAGASLDELADADFNWQEGWEYTLDPEAPEAPEPPEAAP